MPSEAKDSTVSRASRFSAILLQLALLFLSVWVLQQIDLLHLSTLELLGILSLLAIPIAFYQLELPLLTHRLLFDETTESKSATRALFWRGTFLKIGAYIVSMFIAWLILLLGQDLHQYYWYALYIEAGVLFLVCLGFSRSWLRGEVRDRHQPLLGRKLSQYLIVAVLAASFVYLGYAYVGVPDLRDIPLESVWKKAFASKMDSAESKLIGFSLGVTHALSQVAWFAMQRLAPGVDDGGHKAIIWLMFLIPGAIQAAVIVQLHLGLIALVEWKERNDLRVLGRSPAARLFFGTFLIIILFFTWVDYKVSTIELSDPVVTFPPIPEELDPCDHLPTDITTLSTRELVDIERIRNAVYPPVMELIQKESNFVYRNMVPHVDNYLEWYFSNEAQFKLQFLYLADLIYKFGGKKSSKFSDEISNQITRHITAPYANGVKDMNIASAQSTNILLREQFLALAQRLDRKRRELSFYETGQCKIPVLVEIEEYMGVLGMDGPDARPMVGTSVAFVSATFAAKAAGKKLAATVAGKTVSKIVTKIGLSLSSKAVSAGTATAGGASVGAVCGPAAPACAIAGGIAGAVLFEVAFNEVDEALNRKQAESDIRLALLNMSIATQKSYKEAYTELINNSVKRAFRPEYIPGKN